ncbi:hypothetical protein [Acidiphilium sp.]|uniref:hypothetical protein n=1 Tax=Acidiphilium sp. TaxID=527 RepID=UPI003CFD5FE8
MSEGRAMVIHNAGSVKPPGYRDRDGNHAAVPSGGWRPSRDTERLSPGIWIAGFVLVAAIIALMAALFGSA